MSVAWQQLQRPLPSNTRTQSIMHQHVLKRLTARALSPHSMHVKPLQSYAQWHPTQPLHHLSHRTQTHPPTPRASVCL